MSQASAWIPGPPAEPDLSTWWKRLDYARIKIGEERGETLSVNAMAKELDYPAASFASWLAGARPHDVLEIIRRACDYYQIDREWLTWGAVTAEYPLPGDGWRSRTLVGTGS